MAMTLNRNPLVATQGLGASPFQQMSNGSRVVSSALSLELPAGTQQAAAAGDAVRRAVMVQESAVHGYRTAQQGMQADMAQAPVDPQEFVMRKKLEAMASSGMLDPNNPRCVTCLPKLAEMAGIAGAQG